MVQGQDRNLGVTEARIGLTIITCLLLVLGYVVLQQLGGTVPRPSVELRSDQWAEQPDPAPQPAPGDVRLPHVLTPEVWEPTEPPLRTTQRSQWLRPHEEVGENSPGMSDSLELPQDRIERSPLDQPEPWRTGYAPDSAPVR